MKNEITEDFEVNDAVMASFKELLAEKEFEYEDEEMSGDALEYVKKAILREVISKNFGRQAMYRAMLNLDDEFQRVLTIYGVAPTLAEMYQYAEQERNLEKASVE